MDDKELFPDLSVDEGPKLLVAGRPPLDLLRRLLQEKTETERMAQMGRARKVPDLPEDEADDFLRGADPSLRQKYEDRVWSINLKRFEAPEDLIDTLRQAAETTDSPRKEISWKQTREEASRLARSGGLSEDAVLAWTRAQGLNAAQLQLAGQMLMESAERVRDATAWMKAAKDSGTLTNADRVAYRQLLARHAAIMQTYSGMAEEAGRTLNILRSVNQGTKANLYAGQIDDVLSMMGGPETTDQLIDALSDMDNLQAVNRFVGRAYNVRTSDMIHELWLNGLLSGVRTHEVNFLGSGLATMFVNAENLLAGVIGDTRTTLTRLVRRASTDPDAASVRDMLPYLYGEMMGFLDGVRLFGKAFRRGESSLDPMTKFEPTTGDSPRALDQPAVTAENIYAKIGWPPPNSGLAKALDLWFEYSPVGGRLPTRLLVAEDDFWKAINYRAAIHAGAYRRARKLAAEAGMAGDAEYISKMTAKILDELPPELHEEALKAAREATFTGANQPGGIWGNLEAAARGLRHIPVLGRYIVPFARTPINIMRFVYQRSPLGLTDPEVLSMIKAGGRQADVAVARIALGSGLMVVGGLMASSGWLTGTGPGKDQMGLHQGLRRQGWQRRSIRIPAGAFGPNDPPQDQFIQIERTDPVGLFLTLAADTYDIMQWAPDQETAEEIAADVAIAVAESFSDKTYLRGVADFFDAWVSDPKRFMGHWKNRLAGSFVPTIISDVNRQYFDRTRRMVQGVLDAWCARLPGCSKDLPPQRDLWGYEITEENFSMWRPLQVSEFKDYPAAQIDMELVLNRINLQRPNPVWRGIDLREFERVEKDGRRRNAYERFLELAGHVVKDERGLTLVESLTELVNSEVYRELLTPGPDGTRADEIRAEVIYYRELAREQLLTEFPELARVVAEAEKELDQAKGLPDLQF